MGRPCEVLGKAGGIKPIAKPLQAVQVVDIQRSVTSDRQADAMNGYREMMRQLPQLCEGPTTVAHVVFGVNFKPSHRACIFQNGAVVLRFVSDADGGGQMG